MAEDKVIIDVSVEELKGIARKVWDIANGMKNTIQTAIQTGYNGAVDEVSNYKAYVDKQFGDVWEALDKIIAMQEALIPKPTLPTFIINRLSIGSIETCEFEESMSWIEWCDSEYNTIGAYVDGNYISLGGLYIRTSDSFEVGLYESITAGETYYA